MNFQFPIIFSCPVSWACARCYGGIFSFTHLCHDNCHPSPYKTISIKGFFCSLCLVLGQHSPFVYEKKEKWKNPRRQSKLCVRLERRRGRQENIVVICEDSDEIYGRWAQHRDLVCLHSSVRSTERNSAEHFCTAQQSVCLHWLRPAGALLCGNPMSTFHTCAPHGWMGLPSQAVHLWAFFPSIVRGVDSASLFPCLVASCNCCFF